MNYKNDFPMLQKDIVYFDNGATSLKPKCVMEKMDDYYYNYSSNAHRGDYKISLKASSEYEKVRDKVISLFHEKYGIEGEMPFSDDDTSIVFRSLKNKKWIGIMMNIPSSRLNIPGEENVDVINLKHSQSMIPSLIDNRFIFPAWHMNKKTWITVLLSPDLDWGFFSSLLEESRRLVEERT